MRMMAFWAVLALFIPLKAAVAADFTGYWLTENGRSVIHVIPCEQGLCGSVYWITEGGLQYDAHNPDKTRRATPICGLPILWGFEKTAETKWENGKIYKADEGDTYDADLEMLVDGRMKLRGYIGLPLFGKSQIWTRVDPKDYRRCRAPS